MQGLTGEVKFDNEGLRKHISVDMVELTSSGLIKVGNWHSTDGLNISRVAEKSSNIDDSSLKNRTFVVITALVNYCVKICKTASNYYFFFRVHLMVCLGIRLPS